MVWRCCGYRREGAPASVPRVPGLDRVVLRLTPEVSAQLVADLQVWSARFRAGGAGFVQLIKPPIEAGEKWAARTLQVGTARVDRGDLGRLLNPAAVHQTLGRAQGGAFATDRRLFVANFRTVKQEWRWADLRSVRALDGLQGVALDADPDSDTVEVVATDRGPNTPGPTPVHAAAAWLKVEAAFAAFQGRLDPWLAELPARLPRG